MDIDMDIDITRTWVNICSHTTFTSIHIHNDTIIHHHHQYQHHYYYHQLVLRVYTIQAYSSPHLAPILHTYLQSIELFECQTKEKKRELIGIRRDLLEGRGKGEGKEASERQM